LSIAKTEFGSGQMPAVVEQLFDVVLKKSTASRSVKQAKEEHEPAAALEFMQLAIIQAAA
jgi:hypothetical protein